MEHSASHPIPSASKRCNSRDAFASAEAWSWRSSDSNYFPPFCFFLVETLTFHSLCFGCELAVASTEAMLEGLTAAVRTAPLAKMDG